MEENLNDDTLAKSQWQTLLQPTTQRAMESAMEYFFHRYYRHLREFIRQQYEIKKQQSRADGRRIYLTLAKGQLREVEFVEAIVVQLFVELRPQALSLMNPPNSMTLWLERLAETVEDKALWLFYARNRQKNAAVIHYLWEKYFSLTQYLVQRKISHPEEQADLYTELFAKFMEVLSKCRWKGEFKTYFSTVINNHLIDWQRRHARQKRVDLQSYPEEPITHQEDPALVVRREKFRGRIALLRDVVLTNYSPSELDRIECYLLCMEQSVEMKKLTMNCLQTLIGISMALSDQEIALWLTGQAEWDHSANDWEGDTDSNGHEQLLARLAKLPNTISMNYSSETLDRLHGYLSCLDAHESLKRLSAREIESKIEQTRSLTDQAIVKRFVMPLLKGLRMTPPQTRSTTHGHARIMRGLSQRKYECAQKIRRQPALLGCFEQCAGKKLHYQRGGGRGSA